MLWCTVPSYYAEGAMNPFRHERIVIPMLSLVLGAGFSANSLGKIRDGEDDNHGA